MLSKRDLSILSNLRKNSRLKLTTMSKLTHIPTSTIFDRMRVHEQRVIKRYTSLLNYEKLGYEIRANILIKASQECKLKLSDYLKSNPYVNSLFKLNNEYDFIVDVVFRNRRAMEGFLARIKEGFQLEVIEVLPVVEEVKREGFLAEPSIVEFFAYAGN
ncbi:Lrp/AsnC family transcriptional regulator [Candidatus Woesearchaeota archaeon]|nr:Lrp/AsnC family transcriptional regulator [Candidatus Woesearchaeota archaeon]